MAKTIHVQASDQVPAGKVVVWEPDPQHPNGEAYVVGGEPAVEVARTPRIGTLIADGLIELAESPAPKAAPKAATKSGGKSGKTAETSTEATDPTGDNSGADGGQDGDEPKE